MHLVVPALARSYRRVDEVDVLDDIDVGTFFKRMNHFVNKNYA